MQLPSIYTTRTIHPAHRPPTIINLNYSGRPTAVSRQMVINNNLNIMRHNFTDSDWLEAAFLFDDENKQLVRIKVRDYLDKYVTADIHGSARKRLSGFGWASCVHCGAHVPIDAEHGECDRYGDEAVVDVEERMRMRFSWWRGSS
ncbi:hypothetical protein HPP92_009156 [Vanilla planifolia]|uniref:Polyphenol oxidase central domain-containing protein n=1 Tax=Vanilla planifolia TaxID=51239 RepID=A0A835V8K7_VANPL|nr:hypothetical protein HPP92_009156 [Vanilla planifolia]